MPDFEDALTDLITDHVESGKADRARIISALGTAALWLKEEEAEAAAAEAAEDDEEDG